MGFDIGSAIGSALGGGIANLLNRGESERNRGFQERMSSSAHRREVEDLRLAGLNPILSATGGGGASTPTGSTADFKDILTPGISTALDARRLRKEIDATDSQISLNKTSEVAQAAAAVKDSATAKNTTASTALIEAGLPAARQHGKYDADLAPMDAILRRVGDVLGNVNSAKDLLKPQPQFKGKKPPVNQKPVPMRTPSGG